MDFVWKQVENGAFHLVIATHSTAILGALQQYDGVRIAFMRPGQKSLTLNPVDAVYERILPVFGAHPLSQVFKKTPVLLVEGEDDERVWQQAVRTSKGKLKVYPCVCGSVDEIKVF